MPPRPLPPAGRINRKENVFDIKALRVVSRAFRIARLWRSAFGFSQSISLIIGDSASGMEWEMCVEKRGRAARYTQHRIPSPSSWSMMEAAGRIGELCFVKVISHFTFHHCHSFSSLYQSDCQVIANKCWGGKYWFPSNSYDSCSLQRSPNTPVSHCNAFIGW